MHTSSVCARVRGVKGKSQARLCVNARVLAVCLRVRGHTFSGGRCAICALGCSSTPSCTRVGIASRADHTSRVWKTTVGHSFVIEPR